MCEGTTGQGKVGGRGISLLTRGWMVFLLMPLFCLGGIGAPALQSLVTGGVDDEHQGRMQGLLSSMASLASIVGPLAISTVYFASSDVFPGLVWVLGAACHLLCLPVALAGPQAAGVQALDRRSG